MAESTSTDSASIRVLPPLVYLTGWLVGYVLWWIWPIPIVPAGWITAALVVGAIAIILGLGLLLAAAILFHRMGENPDPRSATNALSFSGPYRITRNPMYLGMALVQGGLAFLTNALWPLVALIPVLAVIRTQVIDKEERYLTAKFGDEYRAYTRRVRRWI